MYVCVCARVREADLREVTKVTTKMCEISEATGAGVDCGSCVKMIRSLVRTDDTEPKAA